MNSLLMKNITGIREGAINIKSKLFSSVITMILGLVLVSAPTYAYFSGWGDDNQGSNTKEIDLTTSTASIIDVGNLKPGDTMTRSFTLHNNGSSDIRKVALKTSYTINDVNDDNTEDFGKHIRVNFMYNQNKSLLQKWSPDQVIFHTTLYDLQDMTPDVVNNRVFIPFFETRGGLKAGDSDKLYVEFEFIENRQEQNEFQGDELQLLWEFEGISE